MISTPKGSLEEGLTHIGTAEHGGAVWMANGQRSRSMDFSATFGLIRWTFRNFRNGSHILMHTPIRIVGRLCPRQPRTTALSLDRYSLRMVQQKPCIWRC